MPQPMSLKSMCYKKFSISVIAIAAFLSICSNSFAQNGSLYFCEDYKNGKEIGVSDRFTTGWLTVMVRSDRPLGVGKVELRLTKIADAKGKSITPKIMDTIPFDVEADWDYTYFQDKERLLFNTPGTYRVTLQKVDGTPICSGIVEVTS